MTKQKVPKTIKAFAVVNNSKPKLYVLDVFSHGDIRLNRDEKKCLIEIKFIKWLK